MYTLEWHMYSLKLWRLQASMVQRSKHCKLHVEVLYTRYSTIVYKYTTRSKCLQWLRMTNKNQLQYTCYYIYSLALKGDYIMIFFKDYIYPTVCIDTNKCIVKWIIQEEVVMDNDEMSCNLCLFIAI